MLYLQPKVDMHLGTVVGAEALARWQHPEKGVLSPAAFMPVLEGTEIEVAFGAWVAAAGFALVQQRIEHKMQLTISMNN